MDLKFFGDMFSVGVPVLEKIFRPIIVYIFLVISLRISGKRELAQLNPFDFVVLLTLSNTVQNAIIGNDNSVTGGLIGAATLLVTNYLVVRFLFSHRRIEEAMEGRSDVLIENGSVLYKNLKRELITQEELEMAAHKQGFSSLREISSAVIDPDGVISFTGRKPAADEMRHGELLERLSRIENELKEIRGRRPRKKAR